MSLLTTSIRPCARTLTGGLTTTVRHLRQTAATPQRQDRAAAKAPDFAFAFDIDGVLLHGSTPIPRASQTLHYLDTHNISYLLLTNGGGLSETTRVRELATRLSLPSLSVSQFVQSHTPFRAHAGADNMRTVLVVGGTGNNCRAVAEEYGFADVLIPADVLAAHPALSPFSDPARYQEHARAVGKKKVDAVMVFNDPRDWALDIQLIVDLLLSDNGQLGTRRPIEQVLRDGHIPVYFSNPDLWWANEYPYPRLGQGGFRAALEGVWRTITAGKGELQATTIGKPHQPTYEYAEEVLTGWRAEKLGGKTEHPELKRVYMVGDNPASDIAGANGYRSPRGTEWVSVLVRTGVFREGDHDGGAKVVVDDVAEAVRWAVEREKRGKE